MVDLGSPAQTFGEGGRTERHDHEFLGIGRLPGSMRATVQDVHHRDGQHMGIDAADVAVERQTETQLAAALATARLVPRMALAPNLDLLGVPSRSIMFHVNGFLIGSIPTEQGIGDLVIDVFDGFQHTFAVVACFVAVAQFQRFVNAGGGAGRNCCPPPGTIRQHHFDFHGRVAARIENFLALINSIVVSIVFLQSLKQTY